MTALLEARGLSGGYGGVPVVRDLDLHVEPGEIVALLGANGAGKSTTLLSVAGQLRPLGGAVLWHGKVTKAPLYRRARDGMAMVPEGRSVITRLSVMANLRLGGDVDGALRIFPELEPHLGRPAGLLSGGQQQMVSVARALSRRPQVLLVDELSLGLAPLLVERLLAALRAAADDGIGVLLVEQHARMALEVADRGYVLRRGRVSLQGSATELLEDARALEQTYLS